MSQIRVTNGNDFDLTDRFNGIEYTFPAGGSEVVSDDVARHIFGLGANEKTPTLTRLGWMMHSVHDYPAAMAKLNKFTFTMVEEVAAPDPEAEMPMSVKLMPPQEESETPAPDEAPEESPALDSAAPASTSLLGKLGAFVASS